MSKASVPTISPSARASRLAVLALLVGASAIGFAPIFVKLSLKLGRIGPSATAFWRVMIALPLLWTLTATRRSSDPALNPARRLSRRWLLLPGVFFTGDLAVWHWSLKFTSAANATLLANFAPVFVALVGWLWLEERFRWAFPIGLLMALGGAVGLMSSSLAFTRTHLLGDMLGILTAVFYAGYQLSVKRLREHFPAVTVLTCATAVSAALLLPIAALSREELLAATLAGWVVLAGLALVPHICGQGLIAWALGHLPASFSSVTLLFQPLVVVVLAWIILHESIGFWQGVGGVSVLIGIVLARHGTIIRSARDSTG